MKTQPESDPQSDSELSEKFAKEFASLGLDADSFENDNDSPQVDPEALKQLARRELDDDSTKLVLRFITRYKQWRTEYCKILVEQFNSNPT